MKRLNKKAFTLIELLAVIIILGVLLLIAVPAVSRYIQESREDTYATNLSKFVDAVSPEVNSYNEPYTFSTDEYLVVPIACLDLERGDSSKSPFGPYVKTKSYVVVTRKENNGGFEYHVAALDETGFGSDLNEPDKVTISDLKDGDTIVPISGNSTDGYSIDLSGKPGIKTGTTAKIALPGGCTLE